MMSYPKISFDGKIKTIYGDGKFIIYRAIDDGKYLPYDETRSSSYVDISPVYGANNHYKFKFVTGARDTPLIGPETFYVDMLPTPTPTCAFYKYGYSHVVSHTKHEHLIGGRYSYEKASSGNVLLTHEFGIACIIYIAATETWYITPNTTGAVVSIDGMSGSVLAVGDDTNTRDDVKKYTSTTRDTYHRYIIRDDYIQVTTLDDIKSYKITWLTEYIGEFYVDDVKHTLQLYSKLIDVPAQMFDTFVNKSACMFTYVQESESPPQNWLPGEYWSGSIMSPAPVITCFRPTPTPTVTPEFTPSPTPIPATPTPTPVQKPLNYFITETDIPILTESGEYLVRE